MPSLRLYENPRQIHNLTSLTSYGIWVLVFYLTVKKIAWHNVARTNSAQTKFETLDPPRHQITTDAEGDRPNRKKA